MKTQRQQAIAALEKYLSSQSLPRLQVALLLSVAGLAGFLASFLLLRLGLTVMWLRYPAAILFAYAIFLLLLRLWLWARTPSNRDYELDFDLLDFDDAAAEALSRAGNLRLVVGDTVSGKRIELSELNAAPPASLSSSNKGSLLDGLNIDVDLEEGWLVVIAIVALLGALLASLYVVYTAPILLAEIMLDGLLLAGLYKRLAGIERRHWLRAAIGRTWLPVLLVVIFFTIAGVALSLAAPGARSIGEVWRQVADG